MLNFVINIILMNNIYTLVRCHRDKCVQFLRMKLGEKKQKKVSASASAVNNTSAEVCVNVDREALADVQYIINIYTARCEH